MFLQTPAARNGIIPDAITTAPADGITTTLDPRNAMAYAMIPIVRAAEVLARKVLIPTVAHARRHSDE